MNAKTTAAYLTLRFEGPEVKPERIADIEHVEPPETASTLAEGGPGWAYDFWESPSAEEYARRQGTPVASDSSQLYGPENGRTGLALTRPSSAGGQRARWVEHAVVVDP